MPGSLLDYAEKQKKGVPKSLDTIRDVDVVVESYEQREGDYGAYAVMDVEMPSGEMVLVQTGANLVMDALHHAQEANDFPVEARFTKSGRTWLIE